MDKKYLMCIFSCIMMGMLLVAWRSSVHASATTRDTARVRKIYDDLEKFQLWILLAREFTPLIKDEYSIRTIKIPGQLIRETIQTTIDASFNAAQLGRTVIKIITEQAPQIRQVIACMRQSDQVLRAASGTVEPGQPEGSLKDVSVPPAAAQCPAVLCTTRRRCIAKLLVELTGIISELFNTAVTKYDPQTGTAQRGLLMNIDLLIDKIVKHIVADQRTQDYLASKKFKIRENNQDKEVTALERANNFLQRLDMVRTVLTYLAEALSGGLNTLNLVAMTIDPTVLPQEKRAEVQEGVDAPVTITDKELEALYAEAAKFRGE